MNPVYKWSYFLFFLFIALVGSLLDIFTKDLIWKKLGYADDNRPPPYVVIENENSPYDDYLQFNCTTNPGIIFGILPEFRDIFFVVTILAIPLIIFVFVTMKNNTWTFTIALGFILAGTIGNVYDRVRYSEVRDFIDLEFLNWPIFNLADSFILVGMLILTLELLLFDDGTQKKKETVGGDAGKQVKDQVDTQEDIGTNLEF